MHVPGVCQQRVQWGSSNLTQGLDQNSRTKGNGQKGEKYLIKTLHFLPMTLFNTPAGKGTY